MDSHAAVEHLKKHIPKDRQLRWSIAASNTGAIIVTADTDTYEPVGFTETYGEWWHHAYPNTTVVLSHFAVDKDFEEHDQRTNAAIWGDVPLINSDLWCAAWFCRFFGESNVIFDSCGVVRNSPYQYGYFTWIDDFNHEYLNYYKRSPMQQNASHSQIEDDVYMLEDDLYDVVTGLDACNLNESKR